MEPGDPDTEARPHGLHPGNPLESGSRERRAADPSLRGQVLDVIADVISGTTTSPEVRRRLLWQLMENPGNPERALLSHLQELEGP